MNLSAWRYRGILMRDGGPIAEIGTRECIFLDDDPSLILAGFEASATLQPSLKPEHFSVNQLYSNCDGSGWARFQHEAIYKAISESLERWAFYATSDSSKRSTHGFDMDPSTNGMAAYPGITHRRAQKTARLEAIERWSLCQWWMGRCGALQLRPECLPAGVDGFEILSPWRGTRIVVLYSNSPLTLRSYGFAAENTLSEAIRHARVEQLRNAAVLSAHTEKLKEAKCSIEVSALYEKRLLYFSSEGFSKFFERLQASSKNYLCPNKPEVIIDGEIPGPWTHYATVWRYLLDPDGLDGTSTSDEYFLF